MSFSNSKELGIFFSLWCSPPLLFCFDHYTNKRQNQCRFRQKRSDAVTHVVTCWQAVSEGHRPWLRTWLSLSFCLSSLTVCLSVSPLSPFLARHQTGLWQRSITQWALCSTLIRRLNRSCVEREKLRSRHCWQNKASSQILSIAAGITVVSLDLFC